MLQEWIHLEFEPGRPMIGRPGSGRPGSGNSTGSTPDSMPFQGDQLDELLCKVLWNLDLRREDVEQFRSFFCGSYPLFPEGLSVCQFPDATSLRRWKERLFVCGFSLQQDWCFLFGLGKNSPRCQPAAASLLLPCAFSGCKQATSFK